MSADEMEDSEADYSDPIVLDFVEMRRKIGMKPKVPLETDCCHSDCGEACVFERYDVKIERWRDKRRAYVKNVIKVSAEALEKQRQEELLLEEARKCNTIPTNLNEAAMEAIAIANANASTNVKGEGRGGDGDGNGNDSNGEDEYEEDTVE